MSVGNVLLVPGVFNCFRSLKNWVLRVFRVSRRPRLKLITAPKYETCKEPPKPALADLPTIKLQLFYLDRLLAEHFRKHAPSGVEVTYTLRPSAVSFLESENYRDFILGLRIHLDGLLLHPVFSARMFLHFDFEIAKQMMGYIQYMQSAHPDFLPNVFWRYESDLDKLFEGEPGQKV